jgi:hypothetical protein
MDSGLSRILPSYGYRNRLKGYRGISLLISVEDNDTADEAIWGNWLFVSVSGPTYTLTASPGTFEETGNAVGLHVARKLAADQGAFTQSGIDAALVASRKIVLASGSITLTGSDVSLVEGASGPTYTLTAENGTIAATGSIVLLIAARKIVAASGSFVIVGNAVSLEYTPAGGSGKPWLNYYYAMLGA